jgi:uncharacterized protein (TIRG00374 family)
MTDLRRRLVVVFGVAISVAALYLVLQSIDLGEAVDVLATADPLPLLAIVGVVGVQVVVRAFRWSLLLPRMRGKRIPWARLVPPLLVGYLGNAILPARLGEPMRAVIAARRERVGMPEALASVLLERVVDVATLAPVAFAAALLANAPSWATQVLGVIAAGGLVILAILTTVGVMPLVGLMDRLGLASRPVIRGVIARFSASLGGPSRRLVVLSAASISVASWFLDAGSVWLVATSVGVELDYPAAMLIAGVGTLGTAIPSAPGYVGTYELAVAGIAGALGVPPAQAFALALLVHAMTLGPVALGGAISVVGIGANIGEVAHAAEVSGHD